MTPLAVCLLDAFGKTPLARRLYQDPLSGHHWQDASCRTYLVGRLRRTSLAGRLWQNAFCRIPLVGHLWQDIFGMRTRLKKFTIKEICSAGSRLG